jgi:hypothetical protein
VAIVLDVFISHSSKDQGLAEDVTGLIRNTIDLMGEVRCTSVHGHGLAIGSRFADRLRADIEKCDVFIVIVSPHSLNSQFCLFEIGAAWGLEQPIKPILAPGMKSPLLKPPLSDFHCLRWNDEDGWVQLIREIRKLTKGDLKKLELVTSKVRELCAKHTTRDKRAKSRAIKRGTSLHR